MWKQSFGFHPNDRNEGSGGVEDSEVWLGGNCITMLNEEEDSWWHHKKFYANTYGSFIGKTVEQFLGNICAYTEFWVSEQFSTIPKGDDMRVIMVPTRR